MKSLKNFVFAILFISLLTLGAAAQSKRKKTVKKVTKKPSATQTRQQIRERKPPEFDADSDGANVLKTIAEGSDSSITKPFVFVARTQSDFLQLQKLVNNLPNHEIDFNRTAIVAAFAGTKNTGGYSLDIKKIGDKISIKIAAPPADAMVTESLTTPYKIVALEIKPKSKLTLDLSSDFSGAKIKN